LNCIGRALSINSPHQLPGCVRAFSSCPASNWSATSQVRQATSLRLCSPS
jgi:hypothetical protein